MSISVDLYGRLDALSETYALKAFNVLAPQTAKLFGVFIAVWLVWQLGVNLSMKGEFDRTAFFKTLIGFLLIQTFLQTSGYYWDYFYIPVKETTVKLAQAVVSCSGHVHGQDIRGLLETVEKELGHIFKLQKMISKDTSFYQPHLILGGLILIIPYVFVWGLFLAYTLEGIFKLMAITTLAPLFIASSGFSSTRSFTTAAAKTVLGGCLTVIFAGVAMGFTISVLKHYMGSVPMNADGMTMNAGEWIYGIDYWALFLIGFTSILFHLKASSLASNISGTSDGPTAAALVTGAAMSAAGYAKSMTGYGASKAVGLGGEGFDALTKATKTGKYAWTGKKGYTP